MSLLSLDPGLDTTGWAVFGRPDGTPLSWAACARWCLGSGSVTTSPWKDKAHTLHAETSDRLLDFHRAIAGLCTTHAVDRCLIESPPMVGAYRTHLLGRRDPSAAIASGMQYVFMVSGALQLTARLAGADVGVRVNRGKSGETVEDRYAMLLRAWPALVKSNEHQRDAIIQGIRELTGGHYHDGTRRALAR